MADWEDWDDKPVEPSTQYAPKNGSFTRPSTANDFIQGQQFSPSRPPRGRGFQPRHQYDHNQNGSFHPQPQRDYHYNNSNGSSSNGSGSNYNGNQSHFNGGPKIVIKIDDSNVGRLIGKQGATIIGLKDKSGAFIKVINGSSNNGETDVEIAGTDEQRGRAQELIDALLNPGRFDTLPLDGPEPVLDAKVWEEGWRQQEVATKEKFAALPPVKKMFYFEDPEVAALSPETVAQLRLANNNVMVSHFKPEADSPMIPNPVQTFTQAFEHFPEILDEIQKNGFSTPSPIQSQAWPILLQGKDLIGIAQTGTGKTLAFLLPAMIHIDNQPTPRNQRRGPTALVLSPTRELAQQIERESSKYCYRNIKSLCIYGGGDRRSQSAKISGAEIIIATPGRLNDLASDFRSKLSLDAISYVVLDEADRMLDMGFEPQIRRILEQIRPDRQTVMMSATWPSNVRQLAAEFMISPMQVFVGNLDLAATHTVSQRILVLDQFESKKKCLQELLGEMQNDDKVIIFMATKSSVDELSYDLRRAGIPNESIHGGRDQCFREQALDAFKKDKVRVLVATDVASRGLDIDDITHIINFDFPNTVEEYVHRIGRTGRAGKQGASITMMTRDDGRHGKELIKILTEAGQEVPQELRKLTANNASNPSVGYSNYGRNYSQGRGRGRPSASSNVDYGQWY